MPRPAFGVLAFLVLFASALFAQPAALSGETAQGPEEILSPLRSRVLLNGVWRFQPAAGPAEKTPVESAWGAMPVPGSWIPSSLPGLASRGAGAQWDGVGENLARAWYERSIEIPASWAGRSVALDFRRLSTDASVTIDGVACGEVRWPYGEVDISAAVTPGKRAVVRIHVLATADAGESLARMGYAVEKSVKNKLASAGLTGEVWL
ncbi:MAG: hypothetical protein H7067_01870, partial [Burkholderiales bacterium]|nr:hypothetical protein [Opitutaceae bacterium]